MGNVVMPKNSADMDVLIPILEYYNTKESWVENADYISYIKQYLLDNGIDTKERESQHYTKRMQVLSYFGFIEWEDISNSQSKRRITNLGKKFYEAIKNDNIELRNEVLIKSLDITVFGRNNYGAPSSDSDVEAPILCIRAILDLEYITKTEFAYLLYNLQDNGFTYTTVIHEINCNRQDKSKQINLPADAEKYIDWKPITFLERLNFLEINSSGTIINDNVLKKYKYDLLNLKIYNIDKNIIENESHKVAEFSLISPAATPHTSPEQIIFYGVPGSGKSHEIKQKLVTEYNMPEEKHDVFVERTVFHPEYTNADFIGQIMPKLVQGKTDFIFKPGPFTSILKKALHDSQSRYVLIIEEINRGNAAAIFGELFQLLDRIDDESKLTYHENELNFYGKGWSEYFVMNSEINNYIRDSDDSFDGKALDLNGIHFSANTGIRLPPNLSILATMNTSDQNVFTLDNAFQRRWDMKLIENVFGDTEEEKYQKDAFVDTARTITWEQFQQTINIRIGRISEEAGLSSMEDKHIGCWFIKAVKQGDGSYIIPKDLFAEKVLKYLWDDAFKFCREKVFNGYTSLESLAHDFKGQKGFAVFKDLFSGANN